MPGLVQRNARSSNAMAAICPPPVSATGSMPSNGIWSKHRDDVSFDQLQKFWSELPPQARQDLLKIDKQALFEQARKNLYCSRCNGLLLEGFSQIVMYGKSLQQDAGGAHLLCKVGTLKNEIERESEVQDPSVHPWGGLVATRDGTLTLMDCYLYGKSLWALQNVFDSARARERERELLYPDACGGGGRGWISHGMANYGRVHGSRETCALHTARLSCDTLVDFWSALGDETRLSLLRMKEEDFIERLMYRFDSKRFCRDCRRNVIREFKELKELKRMRRETRCTSWFCVADTAFQYEVSDDTVQADWHQSFTDTVGTYHHFEWAIGTGEGKSDVLEFEDVGMAGEVQVNGLDLGDLDACFITLRAWRLDGRCTELTVKAHALKGQPCVHRRLVVGDGFVTITKGENIRRFFEHAEEAEEEEDDDSIDKDGNDMDSDGSRPQKHAKSPELAREFLLDAATVIFKEQVEKAFREGTARQNAHSIFVCLALKLLEERIHVACKEIITLEKQIKLLEEEEKEKREEVERKERRRTKEREKKLRRKERLKGKERDKERKDTESDSFPTGNTSPDESPSSAHEEALSIIDSGDSNGEREQMPDRPVSPDIVDEQSSNISVSSKSDSFRHTGDFDGEFSGRDANGSFILEQSKSARRKLRFKQDCQVSNWSDRYRSTTSNNSNLHHDETDMKVNGYSLTSARCIAGVHRHSRGNTLKTSAKSCSLKFNEKFQSSKNRTRDGYDHHSCSCSHNADYKAKDDQHISTARSGREIGTVNKIETALDTSRQLYDTNKFSHGFHLTDSPLILKGKPGTCRSHLSRAVFHTNKVWEPTDSSKKCLRTCSNPAVTLTTSSQVDPSKGLVCDTAENRYKQSQGILQAPEALDEHCPGRLIDSRKACGLSDDDSRKISNKSDAGTENLNGCPNGFALEENPYFHSKVGDEEIDSHSEESGFPMNSGCDPLLSSSSSDNCSSCLSEVDSSSSSSSAQNAESSSTSDSEDASQQSEGREISTCNENSLHRCPDDGSDGKNRTDNHRGVSYASSATKEFPVVNCAAVNIPGDKPAKNIHISDVSLFGYEGAPKQQQILPIHNHGYHMPYFAPPTVGYHNQSQASWSATPANGLISFPQPHSYLFPNPLAYGLPTNQPSDFYMQYNSLQPLTVPVLNVSQPPVYQTANKVNIVKPDEQMKNLKANGISQANGICGEAIYVHRDERLIPVRQKSPRPPSTGEIGAVESAGKSHKGIPSFSLFHFGGPVAVASGCNSDPASLKNESSETQTKNTCPEKETTPEEYSLFASRSGFSIF